MIRARPASPPRFRLVSNLRRVLATLTLMLVLVAPAPAQSDVERAKIEYLIDAVAQLHDAVFIRNGTDYASGQAADHMRLKLRNAAACARTAEDFIARCATNSSMSGERYRIRFADGRVVDNAVFLRQKLAEYPAPP